MSEQRLLERQVSLLAYLTSRNAILDGDAPLDPLLGGFDTGLLRLEARFSHEKRMAKIEAVFPRTLEVLGDAADRLACAFIEECPPVDISRLGNAEEFYRLLGNWLSCDRGVPSFVRDIAACEIAVARIQARADDRVTAADLPDRVSAIRRHPDAVLLRCAYDIRPVFENEGQDRITKRRTRLAIALPSGATGPQIFEVPLSVFRLLASLDAWVDPAEIDTSTVQNGLISELAAVGLLDIR